VLLSAIALFSVGQAMLCSRFEQEERKKKNKKGKEKGKEKS
jgi:hypothetical protein